MSNSLKPHGLQHGRLPYPSPSPAVCSNSCPLSQWCNSAISSSAIPPSHPLPFPSPSALSLYQHQNLFQWVSSHISWSKYWSISPSNAYSRLISLRIDWFDLLPVQGTLKNLLQHRSSKASIFWLSAFFMVQLSYLYMTTGKTVALTRQILVCKVMSLLFNMMSRLVIAFLTRSKHLLISSILSSK